MEDGIDALDYATIQIFSDQNRYEAYVCGENKVEKLAVGHLEHLLQHLPSAKDTFNNGSNGSFKIQPPGNLNGATWFTKSTFNRFLHLVDSMDLVNKAKVIEGEICQLEEDRKFHLSLHYGEGREDHFESLEKDGHNPINMASISEPEIQIASSDTSKNELLRAMDSRLTALRRELVMAFNQAAGAPCSCKDIHDLAEFSGNFGAKYLKDLLCKLLELNQNGQTAIDGEKPSLYCALSCANESKIDKTRQTSKNGQTAIDGEKPSFSCALSCANESKIDKTRQTSKNGQTAIDGEKPSFSCALSCANESKIDKIRYTSNPVNAETPVKYGVSPAKVAQVERQSSTESEESSDSSEEDIKSAERSRALVRSASPRRSASPMRRIQIGRTGPRRAMPLTIKSLNQFSAREKKVSTRDVTPDSSEGEGSNGHTKELDSKIQRMSVQDAINLFESKQRDLTSDTQKRSTVASISLAANKSILRRWSAGIAESSVQCQPHVSGDFVSATPDETLDREYSKSSVEVNFECGVKNLVETTETGAKLEKQEGACVLMDFQANNTVAGEEEVAERLRGSVECNQKKEADLSPLVIKIKENQSASLKEPQVGARKYLLSKQYGHSKEKRNEKLQAENAGKRAEKEAPFRALQQIVDEKKTEMGLTSVNPVGRKQSLQKQQKSLNNRPQTVNARKEGPKPSTKKMSTKPPLPATRKSWPSAQTQRATGISSTKNPNGISSASTTSTCLKSQAASSFPRSRPKVESQVQQRNMDSRTGNSRSLKPVDKNMQQRMIRSSKTINAKVATASGDSPTMIPSKPGVVKATKKSSVVPIESKSLSRKSLGIGRATHPVVSKVKGSQLDESLKGCGNVIETQEKKVVMNALTTESGLQDVDTVSVGQHGAAVGSEPPAKSHQDHDKISNFDLLPGDCNHGFKDNGVSSKDDEVEEESTISPTAWIEIEEHEDVRNSCVNRASQLESSANVVPVQSASPRVRHSLSQMLQEESSEADNTEWENAENPPIMTNQKDAPKGLKRLLKFARKSKGDANISGLSSPLVFSEGEDEGEESKVVSKRNADNLLRKAALHARNYGYQKKSLSEVHEQNKDSHEPLSAQSNLRKLGAQGSRKLDKGSFSATSSTTKQQGHSSLFRHLWGANRVK